MSLLAGTVSLIQLDKLSLVISAADTLMIGQSSEVVVSDSIDRTIGTFEYANSSLPAYYLNDKLAPIQDSLLLEKSQFSIGLRTSDEADFFVLVCNQFEQLDLNEEAHNMQELPGFMCNNKMLVQGMLEYQNQMYLMTTADKIRDYITSTDTNSEQKVSHA